jgi:hypothetical protein
MPADLRGTRFARIVPIDRAGVYILHPVGKERVVGPRHAAEASSQLAALKAVRGVKDGANCLGLVICSRGRFWKTPASRSRRGTRWLQGLALDRIDGVPWREAGEHQISFGLGQHKCFFHETVQLYLNSSDRLLLGC